MARGWRREGKAITATVLPQLRAGAQYATDRATTFAKDATKRKIRAVGLGRLENAVGSTSSLKRGKRSADGSAYGVIYARGSTESRGNQALLAYSEGASISPLAGKSWLAFPTNAIPKRVGRKKITPELYGNSGLVSSIGKLHFVPISSREAVLVAKKVTVSRRTGRAKAFAGKTPRGADRKGSVIAFILIRYTSRAKRFSQAEIMIQASAQIGRFLLEYQERGGSGG